ncbi:MAG: Polysaccharide biosynthesis protein [candidate division BRC1 bacterium ADurb.BinA364]|nr:MAG: Polysaccharide biosynthesis protein [candidate division BRC1 bacterium ADurb.BinA364]
MTIAAQLADFGINVGFIRFAAEYEKTDRRKAERLHKLALLAKAAGAGAVCLLGLALSSRIAQLFHDEGRAGLYRMAFAGSAGVALWGYIQAALRARQLFRRYACLTLAFNLFRFGAIVWLWRSRTLGLESALYAMALAPIAAFVLSFLFIPTAFISSKGSADETKRILRDLAGFSKWVMLSTLATMLLMRTDLFMLKAMASEIETGLYGSASTLAQIFPVITGALTTVLLPTVSALDSAAGRRRYLGYMGKLALAAAIACAAATLAAGPLVRLLLGGAYAAGIPVLRTLIVALSLGLVVNPVAFLFYARKAPHLLSLLNCLQLCLNVALNAVLIPRFGAQGAAISTLTVHCLAAGYVAGFARAWIRE